MLQPKVWNVLRYYRGTILYRASGSTRQDINPALLYKANKQLWILDIAIKAFYYLDSEQQMHRSGCTDADAEVDLCQCSSHVA